MAAVHHPTNHVKSSAKSATNLLDVAVTELGETNREGKKNKMLFSSHAVPVCVCTLLSNLICEKLWGFD